MFMIRKILKLLRGQVTSFQVIAACVLGATIGFMPGFAQAPGLIVALTLLLIVLNANLLLAALTGGAAAIAALVLMPVSFHLGRLLLDGPTQPIFKAMINAPLLALFGFEHYATTGGLVLGVVLGVAVGVIIVQLLNRFRAKMASLEEGSQRYQRWTGKKWVRTLTWIVAGGSPKQGYKTLLESRKRGLPVRPLGVVVALGVVALAVLVQMFASGPIVLAVMRAGLERTNGATVDMTSADLNLREGRLVIEGLAMADPNALDTDLFRAARVEADVSVGDLLRKRLAIDSMVISGGSSGEPRRVRGSRTRTAPQPVPEPTDPQDKTLEDYLADAKRWKDRLAQARQWLERISGPGDEPTTDEQRETLRDRLARRVAEQGYANVRAEHLIDGAPTLLITDLLAEQVRVAYLEGETVDFHGRHLSTHPHLVDQTPQITVRSSGGTLLADLALAGAAAGGGEQDNRITLDLKGLSGDRIGAALAISGTPPIREGTIDVLTEGTWRAGRVDLPLNITLRDTTLSVPGAGSKRISRLDLPLGVRGRLDDPVVLLNEGALADALMKAGASELANHVRGEARQVIDRAADDVSQRLGNEAGGVLRGLIGNRRDDSGGNSD